jgi:phosphatidylserine synthase
VATSMLTSFLYHLRHLSLTLSIPSLFDQGDGNVARDTKVKYLGVEGVNDSKDGGVVESYVSAGSMPTSFLYHMSSLIEFINPFSLCHWSHQSIILFTFANTIRVWSIPLMWWVTRGC